MNIFVIFSFTVHYFFDNLNSHTLTEIRFYYLFQLFIIII